MVSTTVLRPFLSVALAVALLAGAGCGAIGGPQERTFLIEVRNGQPVGGVKTFQAKQGDTVKLKLSSDAPVEFHLHGYDLEEEVKPGQPGEITFLAEATGRFALEIEETKTDVAFLEVQPR